MALFWSRQWGPPQQLPNEPCRSIPCRQRGIRVGTSLRQVGHHHPQDGDGRMTATTTQTATLYLALELSQDKWLLACATQAAEKPRFRSLPARDLTRLQEEIAKAKQRFRLPADAPVCTCYEAGRDGFWLHRALGSSQPYRLRGSQGRRGRTPCAGVSSA